MREEELERGMSKLHKNKIVLQVHEKVVGKGFKEVIKSGKTGKVRSGGESHSEHPRVKD